MSTFSAPMAATSGLQGYDLEGATGVDVAARRKVPKDVAGYTTVTALDTRCRDCTMFVRPNACTKVIGKISPDARCRFFAAKKAAKAAKRTLYINRPVRNGEELVAWAKAAGFPTTLTADDLHVTIAYSKTAVDWDQIPRSDLPILRIVGGKRQMKRLGKAGEAAVLGIASDDLERRHRDIHAAGAVWSHPSFQPHITISYAADEVDFDRITPFGGVIELGPEQWAEVKEGWMDSKVEKAALPAAGVALIHDGKALFLRRTGSDHGGQWNFPGGALEKGETPQLAAVRETLEEIGFAVPGGAESLQFVVCANGQDVNYTTFIKKLDASFEPNLNDEHDAFRWAALDQPPDPLHPGVRAILPLVLSAATETTVKAADAALVKGAGAPAVIKENPMDNLALFVQLKKVDAKERIVYGTAVVEEVDRSGEIFDYKTSKPEFEKWSSTVAKTSDGKSLGNVRAMHSNIAAGKLVDIGFDDERKAIDVAAKVVDDNEWKKVEEGVYTGFSIGGKYLKRWQDGANKRYTASPSEVSLVDLPCGPSATFSMIKADGSEEMRKFASAETEAPKVVTNEMVAARATELAKAAGDEKNWIAHVEEARKALEDELAKAVDLKAADAKTSEAKTDEVVAEPAKVEKAEGEAEVEKADGEGEVEKSAEIAAGETGAEKPAADEVAKTTPDDIVQVWASARLPGKTFAKKAELTAALIALEAQEEAQKAVADVLGKTEKIEPKAETTEPVAKTEEVNADREALVKAVAAYEAAMIPTTEAAKRDLVKQARALDALDVLPEGWIEKAIVLEGDDLAKYASVHLVSDLMCMLACVQQMEARAEMQTDYGVNLPKELTDRFGAALVELGDISAAVLDVVLTSIKAEQVTEAKKSVELVELIKRGARNSAKDKGLIKQAHDALASLDKDCCGSMGKAEAGEDLAKAQATIGELEIRLDATKSANAQALEDIKAGFVAKAEEIGTLKAENEALKAANAELAKKVDNTDALRKEIQQIRLQPAMTPPGTFRVVEKAVDISNDFSKVSEDELRTRAAAASLARQAR
jgi:8-oxo-dGTP pyrophosphatase MutT (NUDIX family)